MNTQNTRLYISYARKSSEDNKERQAASLPDQTYIINNLKNKLKLKVVTELQESKSAHTPQHREAFKQMIILIEQGKANAIVTWHLNRLARNPVDGGYIIFLMDSGKLIEILTPSRTYHNTPEDKFMLTLEFGLSKKDSDDKSIVVKRGLEKKLREGWRPGWAPIGYLNDKGTESGFRRIYVDSKRLPFVKKIFELFLIGTPAIEILRISHIEWHLTTPQRKRIGGKLLSLSELYMIFNNPFYCGKFEYPVGSGNWYENNPSLERAVTEEDFNKVQIKLGSRSKYKLAHHEYAYTALMKCGYCESGIVGEEKNQVICTNCKYKFSLTKKNKDHCTQCDTRIENMKNPTILHYEYYRCGRKKKISPSCKQRGVEVRTLEKMIDEKLEQVEISPLFMDWALRQIHKMNDSEKNFREDTVEAIKRSYDACRTKLDNLLQLKIAPENIDGSLISNERYKVENEKLESELKSIEKQLVTIDSRMLQANRDTAQGFDFVTRARERFAAEDIRTKRDIFMGLGSHLRLLDKTVLLDSPKYLFIIKKMKEEAPIIAQRVAPNNQSLTATKMEAEFASIPTVLRGRESRPA